MGCYNVTQVAPFFFLFLFSPLTIQYYELWYNVYFFWTILIFVIASISLTCILLTTSLSQHFFLFCPLLANTQYIDFWMTCSYSFWQLDVTSAQLLVTDNDFRDKDFRRQLNDTVKSLLSLKVIPIFNENDAVSTRKAPYEVWCLLYNHIFCLFWDWQFLNKTSFVIVKYNWLLILLLFVGWGMEGLQTKWIYYFAF